MKKDLPEEAFCPNCEWRGEATGLTSCPECGSELSNLDALEEEVSSPRQQEKYPEDFLARIKENDDNME